ncbi:hypothetical protein [Halorubrum trapanicum]|uniref:hypothetical protein n=1 Tax=Halorubrum trapanicum TaxID=29284 RepID=UPI0012FE0911|nr:hypothetical protein [Halorubrum trapanicum]
MLGTGGLVSLERHGFRTMRDDDERYETLCRVFNEALADGKDGPIEIELSADEREVLASALAYHRELTAPYSGDAVGRTEYECPGCGGGKPSSEPETDRSTWRQNTPKSASRCADTTG